MGSTFLFLTIPTIPPDNGDVLTWNSSTSDWEPAAAPSGSFSANGDLSGTGSNQTVIGLQGRPVSNAAPTSTQVLTWNGSAWAPAAGGGGGGGFTAGGDLSGSSTVQTVIGVQTVAISATPPSTGQVLTATSSSAADWATPASGFTAGGDLSGTSTSQEVAGLLTHSLPSLSDGYLNWTGSSWALSTIGSGFTAGGDLSGSSTDQTVIAIQGHAASSSAPSTNQVFVWTGSAWAPTTLSASQLPALSGDVSGATNLTVVQALQGKAISATPPTSGQVLEWNGSAWTPTTASGSPTGSAGGDLGGTYPDPSVVALQGNSITSGTLTEGQFLVATSTSNWAATTLSGDITESVSTPGQLTVSSITGAGGNIPFNATIIGDSTTSFPVSYGIDNLVLASDADHTLLPAELINPIILITSSLSLTANRNIIMPAVSGALYYVFNHTTGGQSLTFKATTGAGIVVPNGLKAIVYFNGTNYNTLDTVIGGDLTATTNTSQTVAKINGATVPVSGSLTSGNVLQVSGSAALSYAALNLAGGANFVAGVLPTANQANQNMGGDVSGTTASSTVVALQGSAISSTPPTSNQLLEWNGSAWTPTTVSSLPPSGSAGGDLGGSYPNPTVVALQGNAVLSGALGSSQDGYVLTWNNSASKWEPEPAAISFTAGGDLSGTNTSQTVIAIHGTTVPASPSANQVLVATSGIASTWEQISDAQVSSSAAIAYSKLNLTGDIVNADISSSAAIAGSKLVNATTGATGVIQLAGDLGGTGTSPSVLSIHGATVPVGGSLTTGNTLGVTGAGTLGYSALNLGGGANYVSGTLPIGNQAAQSLGGGLSGTTASATVLQLQAVSISATSPSTGQILTATSSTAADWATPAPGFTAGGDLSGTSTSQQVVSITGTGGSIPFNATIVGTSGSSYPVNYGVESLSLSLDANHTLSSTELINPILNVTSSVSLTATRSIILPATLGAMYWVYNHTTGGQSLTFIASSGTGVTLSNGLKDTIYFNGTNYEPIATVIGGDLSATTNTSQTVAKINGTSIPATPSANQVLVATSGTTATWEQISDAEISSAAAIEVSKLAASSTDGYFLQTNGSGIPAWTQVAGDISITSSGLTTVQALQGNPVANTAPTNSYVLTWNGTSWAPAISAGTGFITTTTSITIPAVGASLSSITFSASTIINGEVVFIIDSSGNSATFILSSVSGSTATVTTIALGSGTTIGSGALVVPQPPNTVSNAINIPMALIMHMVAQ